MASILEEVKGSGKSVSSQESTPGGGVKSTSEEVKGESGEEEVKSGSEEEVKGGSGEEVKGGSETEEGEEEEDDEEEEEKKSVFYCYSSEPESEPGQDSDWEEEEPIYIYPMSKRIDEDICKAINKDDAKGLMEALPKDENGNAIINTWCGGGGVERRVGWMTLLHCACSKGKLECVKALCHAGANLLVGAGGYPGTPLHSAIEAESKACNSEKKAFSDIISFLIDHARDKKDGTLAKMVYAANDFGERPRTLAGRLGCLTSVKLLFDIQFKEKVEVCGGSTLEEEADPLKRPRTEVRRYVLRMN